jgi:hypothetical protein
MFVYRSGPQELSLWRTNFVPIRLYTWLALAILVSGWLISKSTFFGPQNARFQELPPPGPLTALSLIF